MICFFHSEINNVQTPGIDLIVPHVGNILYDFSFDTPSDFILYNYCINTHKGVVPNRLFNAVSDHQWLAILCRC